MVHLVLKDRSQREGIQGGRVPNSSDLLRCVGLQHRSLQTLQGGVPSSYLQRERRNGPEMMIMNGLGTEIAEHGDSTSGAVSGVGQARFTLPVGGRDGQGQLAEGLPEP